MSDFYQDIHAERLRQDAKWGAQNHSDLEWLAILMEEVGELAQEVLTRRYGDAAKGHGDLAEERVHVAAVATAWAESEERRNNC